MGSSVAGDGVVLTKGHGTENDFLLYTADSVLLSTQDIAAVCARRSGIGADGVIRAAHIDSIDSAEARQSATAGARWYMDYRNADGSPAEMCGNGARVFAHYLRETGLEAAEQFIIGTAAGPVEIAARNNPLAKQQSLESGDAPAAPTTPAEVAWYRVKLPRGDQPITDESFVAAGNLIPPRPAANVDMKNPHTVVALAEHSELDALDLRAAPEVQPVPQNGTNVEFIVINHEPVEVADPALAGAGHLNMRVHERGVGETRACGTGACAAAVAARHWAGRSAPLWWFVTQPGGTVLVEVDDTFAYLSGPAVLTAEVRLT